MFARLKERKGSKRAIVAVARKLLCVLFAMLRTSTPYKIATTETKAPRKTRKRLVLVRTSPAEQTTTTETTTPRTTPKRPAKAPAVERTTTAEAAVPRATPRRSARRSSPKQTATV
jgi:type IV secretory pathway VirB10-like protein